MRMWLVLAVLAAASPVRADVALLANGASLEGLLVSAAPDAVRFQVATDGYVLLDPATIVSIEPASPRADAALLASWRTRDRRDAAAERRAEAAEASVPAPAPPDEEPAPVAPAQVVVNNYVNVLVEEAAVPIVVARRPRRLERADRERVRPAAALRGPFNVSGFGAFARPFGL